MSNILNVDSLTFGYDKKTIVLDNITFEIEEGTITAILGRNGCGKSTLLDCVLGVNEYKSGMILLNGKNIRDYSNKEFAKNVAYISQSTIINIDYSVREFLLFGRTPYLKMGESPKSSDYEKVIQYAKQCEIDHLLDKEINKISGGERQLCFICRAIIQEAKLFIFDEPTASLDFGNQYKLFSIMKEMQKQGKTVLFTTHNPNQVLELNTNAVVIHNGKILCKGVAKEILTREMLREIYGLNFLQTGDFFKFDQVESE